GFGYAPDPDGAVKVPHRGGVRIEEDVEIGANTTIDRAVLNDTVIGRGSKIDNLVMIGHNNIVGPHCMMAGQVGIAGSCRIGAGVLIGGQAGLGGHLRVGDGAQIGGKSGVHRDIPPGERVLGIPATDVATARRAYAMLYRLPEVRRHIDRVSKRLEELLPPEDE
ncbi:MAG: UDP-3-O-(3-hydroxymyristoyl)glucosamine N-acyltransferase, partial [Planctomycetota bacterium]